jgi:pimeloyl-ACP methyl ester carboxylesterase
MNIGFANMIYKLLTCLCILFTLAKPVSADEVVILLHGLIRTSDSMEAMEDALLEEAYIVHNIDYPSRQLPIEQLAKDVRKQVTSLIESKDTVHFVTHSMGGILVRAIQKEVPLENIGRVVMLSPPNQGSELVDSLGDFSLFDWINGPAGNQLGTYPDSYISSLGPIDFELGVITGDRSINWINSMIIPGKDDGKVSTERAKIEGMQDYKVVHATHPYIMKNNQAVEATLRFLKTGSFETL